MGLDGKVEEEMILNNILENREISLGLLRMEISQELL